MSVSEMPRSTTHMADVVELPTRAARRRAGPWYAYVLVAGGVGLVPWLVVLAVTLPSTATAPHWTVAWVGLDAMEAAGLVASGVLALRRHPLLGVAAGATAMLLLVDAWFDVTTSAGPDVTPAVLMALLAELPLAAACATLAIRSSISPGQGGEPPQRAE
jgi:hypothetical protein